MEHICTNEDMVAGGLDLGVSKCPICCQDTTQKAGYIGVYCYGCKRILSGEEWRGDIARQRRELLGMTKRQIGEKIGLSKHTIHAYEWKKCPESYLDKLEVMLRESVSSNDKRRK
jgi:hypothetical protein